VKQIQAIYEDAAQLCSPSPVVDVVPIPETNVVAINVDPYVDQLVAAPAKTRDKQGREIKHDTAWVFPIRRASQTEWIKPENLAMYMNREVRRAVLLLAKIPEERRKKVHVSFHKMPDPANRRLRAIISVPRLENLSIANVSIENNFVELEQGEGSETCRCHVPLTDVLDVWQMETEQWHVLIRGRLVPTPTGRRTPNLEYIVNPRL
jgi:hypothetical protein